VSPGGAANPRAGKRKRQTMPGTPPNATRKRPIVRFPPRRTAVWVLQDEGAWLVLPGSNGWLHGDLRSAFAEAQWLSKNLSLPVRSYVQIGGRA